MRVQVLARSVSTSAAPPAPSSVTIRHTAARLSPPPGSRCRRAQREDCRDTGA